MAESSSKRKIKEHRPVSRPLQYERLVAENRLQEYEAAPLGTWIADTGILFGFAIILIGFLLLILILLGQFYY